MQNYLFSVDCANHSPRFLFYIAILSTFLTTQRCTSNLNLGFGGIFLRFSFTKKCHSAGWRWVDQTHCELLRNAKVHPYREGWWRGHRWWSSLLLRHCWNRLYRSPGRGRNDGRTRTSELFPSYYILHLSGIRMQTGEEVVHSKISEQDEEEGDNTEDMVDDWWLVVGDW